MNIERVGSVLMLTGTRVKICRIKRSWAKFGTFLQSAGHLQPSAEQMALGTVQSARARGPC